MRFPQTPPNAGELWPTIFQKKTGELSKVTDPQYLHWDKIRRHAPPQGYTSEEWWAIIKFQRWGSLKPISLHDKNSHPFRFCVPDIVQQELHDIDIGSAGTIGAPEQITNPQTRDRYLIRSLMEEAITSSQLEGAVTTREVAKEMIRSGRAPSTTDEKMILNNYLTMRTISELGEQPLTPQMIFSIHRQITEGTLDDSTAAGRLRTPQEERVVADDAGEIVHTPPPAQELPQRMAEMCRFANGESPDYFVHPVVRAIILHFWLAYDHPFVDGNGRTARALFYWAMLRAKYWLFEFISISTILKKAPIQYELAFLYTETDDNDLTYFIVYQSNVICRAIKELHEYIDRKSAEFRELSAHTKALHLLNHRQRDIISHALKHPADHYTIASHRKTQGIVYETARSDLLGLLRHGLLEMRKHGKEMVFSAPANLPAQLKRLAKKLALFK